MGLRLTRISAIIMFIFTNISKCSLGQSLICNFFSFFLKPYHSFNSFFNNLFYSMTASSCGNRAPQKNLGWHVLELASSHTKNLQFTTTLTHKKLCYFLFEMESCGSTCINVSVTWIFPDKWKLLLSKLYMHYGCCHYKRTTFLDCAEV